MKRGVVQKATTTLARPFTKTTVTSRHQWQANLRILEVTEIKMDPYVPLSHSFVERLIGTIRREFLDSTLFWTTLDLETKLIDFQHYYNRHRTHAGLEGRLPQPEGPGSPLGFASYRWQKHCRGLYQTPIAHDFANSPSTPSVPARASGHVDLIDFEIEAACLPIIHVMMDTSASSDLSVTQSELPRWRASNEMTVRLSARCLTLSNR
jgi:hypothetical protein